MIWFIVFRPEFLRTKAILISGVQKFSVSWGAGAAEKTIPTKISWLDHDVLKCKIGVFTMNPNLAPSNSGMAPSPRDLAMPAECLTCLSTWRNEAWRHRPTAITSAETYH